MKYKEKMVSVVNETFLHSWMEPIQQYIYSRILPSYMPKETWLNRIASEHIVIEGTLYKKSLFISLLRCLGKVRQTISHIKGKGTDKEGSKRSVLLANHGSRCPRIREKMQPVLEAWKCFQISSHRTAHIDRFLSILTVGDVHPWTLIPCIAEAQVP